ncbi:MAG: hypothetical protein ACC726_12400, partial [Chloroflexota bacterium]
LAATLYDAGFAVIVSEDWNERYAAGRALWKESLALYRELGDKVGIAADLWALSTAAFFSGDVEGAERMALESVELSREAGDSFRVGWGTHLVGLGMIALGRLDESVTMLSESFEIWVAGQDRGGISMLLLDAGFLAEARGRSERGWRLLGAAARVRRESGSAIGTEVSQGPGWTPRLEPETDAEHAWFASGELLDDDEGVSLARAELAES